MALCVLLPSLSLSDINGGFVHDILTLSTFNLPHRTHNQGGRSLQHLLLRMKGGSSGAGKGSGGSSANKGKGGRSSANNKGKNGRDTKKGGSSKNSKEKKNSPPPAKDMITAINRFRKTKKRRLLKLTPPERLGDRRRALKRQTLDLAQLMGDKGSLKHGVSAH